MSPVKERLIGAVTVMEEDMAERLWEVVRTLSENDWDRIEEEEPDELDLQMIRAAETDPDCRTFVP